jgi:N-acetylmuramic acid 6-phosphate etherase
MGRLDRYFSNIMTYVKPTNYKLIDRACRYVMTLRPEYSYEQSVRMLYKIKGQLGAQEPVVLRIIRELDGEHGKVHHLP